MIKCLQSIKQVFRVQNIMQLVWLHLSTRLITSTYTTIINVSLTLGLTVYHIVQYFDEENIDGQHLRHLQ